MSNKLVDMKLSREASKAQTQPIRDDGPRYPYGLCLRLETETLKKLGMSGVQVGDEVQIVAIAKVVSHQSNEHQQGKHESCELQVTSMSVTTQERDETVSGDDSMDEYGRKRMKQVRSPKKAY